MAALREEITKEVLAALEGGPPVLVATLIAVPPESAALLGAKMLLRPDGSTIGSLGLPQLEDAVRGEAADAFRRPGVHTLRLSPEGTRLPAAARRDEHAFEVMVEVHESPPRLLVIGAGHVGKALSAIGHMCGFSVEIVDDRPEFANRERFPEADRITVGRFEEVLAEYPVDARTYIVCVTRGHKHDETSLRAVVGSPAAYIGMIGSRRRVGAVLRHLVEEGAEAEAVARVHTPIGLDIGAETPEEIAVAVMAEIIMVRRGGSGRPMKEAVRRRRGVAPEERLQDA
jgi:xanthine dehydrogenase accessory factor